MIAQNWQADSIVTRTINILKLKHASIITHNIFNASNHSQKFLRAAHATDL